MTTDVRPDGSIRIYPIRRKLWPLLLGAILFVAVSLSLLPVLWPFDLFHIAVAVVSILFFGLCALAILGRILTPSPALVLSREGITDSAWPFGAGFLCWDEVAYVSVYAIYEQRTLGIFLKDAGSIMARLGGAKAGYMKLNLRMGCAPVNISQVTLPMRVEELAELIRTSYRVERKAG